MRNPSDNQIGLTLIEVMLAIYIGMLIFLAMISVYFLGQSIYKTGSNRLEIVQNGRVTLDRLTRELRQTPEIITSLPVSKEEPGNPPPSEIQFQDGHQSTDISYIRYYLSDSELWRQVIVYYFEDETEIYVVWNAIGSGGESPSSEIQEDRLVGEYINDLQFYGNTETTIEVSLIKNDASINLRTKIFGRNTQ